MWRSVLDRSSIRRRSLNNPGSPSSNSQPTIFFAFYNTTTTHPPHPDSSTQPSSPPIRVSLTESAGRGVIATRRIAAGELIHTAKPLISHPSLSRIATERVCCCYLCLKRLKSRNIFEEEAEEETRLGVLFCCEECKQQAFKVFYDVEKQADWSNVIEHCRTQGLKYPLMAKRFACMVLSGAASANSLDILQPAILSREMILQMEKEFRLLRKALEEADIPNEKISFLTKQWYIGVLARIRINAFRIELVGGSYEDILSSAVASVESEAAVGNAIYMLPSFYNHDCDPNAHIVWTESVDAKLKALRDIEEGEELRICYIDASMDYDARQTVLYQGFGFRCSCLRCLSGD